MKKNSRPKHKAQAKNAKPIACGAGIPAQFALLALGCYGLNGPAAAAPYDTGHNRNFFLTGNVEDPRGGYNLVHGSNLIISDATVNYFTIASGFGNRDDQASGDAVFVGSGSDLIVDNATFNAEVIPGGRGGNGPDNDFDFGGNFGNFGDNDLNSAIVVSPGGTVVLEGNVTFDQQPVGYGYGYGEDFGRDNQVSDLFMAPGSSVILNPCAGQVNDCGDTITFNGSISGYSGNLPGEGNDYRDRNAGLQIDSGIVQLNGFDTYSGVTKIKGGVLEATNGIGLPFSSDLDFDGSRYTGGVLATSGYFDRNLGSRDGDVEWTGSGGFAALGGNLTVDLNHGENLKWGQEGFVSGSNYLIFGSEVSNGNVYFQNNLQLVGNDHILVIGNGTTTSDLAYIDGRLTGSGGLTVAGTDGGELVLTNRNTYTGATIVDSGADLLLQGWGSIADSQWVDVNGTLDVSGAARGVSLVTLAGSGNVDLGATQLTISRGHSDFAGSITGTGGVQIARGWEGLSGTNSYTGATRIDRDATLSLIGDGSIADSSEVVDDGTFVIAGTDDGASITTLAGWGRVYLGDQTLTITAGDTSFGGQIDGAGGLAISGGDQTLTGRNNYTGVTTIDSGATLSLADWGQISQSSDVIDNGTFDICGDNWYAAIKTLSGDGTVDLGDTALVITAGRTDFAGSITGAGNVVIEGGWQGLSGTNSYTGETQIDRGATLSLIGDGSIADSSEVVDDGKFVIAGTTDGASITSLAGWGKVYLGDQTLTITAGDNSFAGQIDGAGGLTISGGTETLTGTNSYAGETDVAQDATLVLDGRGSIADSQQVNVDGELDIAGTWRGASITTLSGDGEVDLGSKTLTITAGSTEFDGAIVDPGAGSLVIAGGTETLGGTNTYTGDTTIHNGATLALVGSGSIADSARVKDYGSFDISGTSDGAQIISLSGNGTVALGSETLTLTDASDYFAGVIGGSGGLTIAAGRETLAGTNTFSGATLIDSGARLILAGSGSVADSVQVDDEGSFDIFATSNGASVQSLVGAGNVYLGAQDLTVTNAQVGDDFSGTIAGSGAVALTGGTWMLSGDNSYSGGTTVNDADLIVTGDAALGDETGTLTLDDGELSTPDGLTTSRSIVLEDGTSEINTDGSTVTLNGTISGAGGIEYSGTGIVYATADNSYTGTTIITDNTTLVVTTPSQLGAESAALDINDGGVLEIAGGNYVDTRDIVVAYDGSIVNDSGSTAILSDVIQLNQDGDPITQVFSTDSDDPTTGPTIIGVGSYSLADGLIIDAGSELTGTGFIGAMTTIEGTLEPGDSPGTLTWTSGNVTLTSTADYIVQIDGTGTSSGVGNYSRVVIDDGSFTASGTLTPELRGITYTDAELEAGDGNDGNSYTPALGTVFNVVQAADGVTGSFSSLTEPTSGLAAGTRLDVLYLADDINLYVTPADYTVAADDGLARLSSNQTQSAIGINALRGAAGSRVDSADSAMLNNLYQLTGSKLNQALNELSATIYGDQATGLLLATRGYGEAVSRQAAAEAGLPLQPGDHGWSIWASGLGTGDRVSTNVNTGFSTTNTGSAVGIDHRTASGWLAGVSAGTSNVNTQSEETGASAQSSGLLFAAYGGWGNKLGFVTGQFGFQTESDKVTRTMAVLGSTVQGNDRSNGFNGALQGGLHLATGLVNWQPYAAVQFETLSRGALTEQGGGGNFYVHGDKITAVQSVLGTKVGRTFQASANVSWTPSLFADWQHQYSGNNIATEAAFVGASSTTLRFDSAPIGTDQLDAGGGVAVNIGQKWTLFVNGGANYSQHSDGYNVNGGVQLHW